MVRIIGRLKRRADFLWAAKRGRKAVFPGLIMQAVPYHPTDCGRINPGSDAASVRVGFTASRAVGGAVARNRARRRLRAVVREVMLNHARPGHDYVVIARKATLRRPYVDLRRDLTRGLHQLGQRHRAG